MATFTIKRGDTGPALRYALTPITVDLTGASVTFSMAQAEGAPIIFRAPATAPRLTSPPTVEYQWQPGDTDHAGFFDAEFEVTYPGGVVETFPNNGFIIIEVSPDAGWRPQRPGNTIIWTLGDTVNQPLVLTRSDGQPLDLTGATVTASVRIGATWVSQTADVHDPLIGEAWPDWPALNLGPRAYPLKVTITWPDAARETEPQHFTLSVQE